MVSHYQRMQEYEAWAGGEVIASLRGVEALLGDAVGPGGGATMQTQAVFKRARGIFAHLQMARHEWLSRLGGVARRPWIMFPDWSVDECDADRSRLDALWWAYLQRPEAEDLAGVVTYQSTEGRGFANPRGDILAHVYNHSSYHRGQIAMLVRQCGGTPASSDFIVFSRNPTG
jgi:uncharacterized damage-inducible protein DinB